MMSKLWGKGGEGGVLVGAVGWKGRMTGVYIFEQLAKLISISGLGASRICLPAGWPVCACISSERRVRGAPSCRRCIRKHPANE